MKYRALLVPVQTKKVHILLGFVSNVQNASILYISATAPQGGKKLCCYKEAIEKIAAIQFHYFISLYHSDTL